MKDAAFKSFEKACFNYLPGAPEYFARFTGLFQYANHGKGFGYYKNHRVRLFPQRVSGGTTRQ